MVALFFRLTNISYQFILTNLFQAVLVSLFTECGFSHMLITPHHYQQYLKLAPEKTKENLNLNVFHEGDY